MSVEVHIRTPEEEAAARLAHEPILVPDTVEALFAAFQKEWRKQVERQLRIFHQDLRRQWPR